MLTKIFKGILLLLCVFCFCAFPVYGVSIDNIEIYQVDWEDSNGITQVQNSAWGRLDMDVAADLADIYYLNVLAEKPGTGSSWVIQNYPIFSDDIGRAASRQQVEFDITELGVSVGTALGSIDLTYSLTALVQASAPVGIAVSYVSESIKYNMGHKDEVRDFSEIGTPAGHKAADPVEKENVIQHKDVPAVQEGKQRCLAGALARSISWLDKEHNLQTGKNAQEIYEELRGLGVGSKAGDEKVTSYEEDIAAKDKYLKEKSGGTGITKILDPEGYIGAVTGVEQEDSIDVLQWIMGELVSKDVELHYDTHIVTITGFYKQGDKHYVKFRDDETQGDDTAGDTGEKEALIYKSGGSYYFRESGSASSFKVKVLISESVPEPATLLLLGSALTGIFISRGRKTT